MPKRKGSRSKFKRWVMDEMGGTRRLSYLLDCSQTTIQHWLAGRAFPSAYYLQKILELADGRITVSEIMRGCRAK